MANRFYRVGGLVTDTPSDIICLQGFVSSTDGRVATLRKVGSAAGYPITAGKIFYITKILVTLDGLANITMSQFSIEPPTAMFGAISCGEPLTLAIKIKFVNDFYFAINICTKNYYCIQNVQNKI